MLLMAWPLKIMSKRELPPHLFNKFMEGVEDDAQAQSPGWQQAIEARPPRLGLGADPKKAKSTKTSNTERRINNMVQQDNESSDSEVESRSKIGKK